MKLVCARHTCEYFERSLAPLKSMAGDLSTAIHVFEFKRAFKILKTVEFALAKRKQKK
jgi:hypothetical protein